MDHRELLKSLSFDQRRRLTEKSNIQGLMHLAYHFGLIIIVAVLIATGVPGWPLLMVLQGLLIIFLFSLLHETSHDTVFKSERINRVVGYLCGFILFLPAGWFRYFHFAHHRHTHDPENDPELKIGKPDGLWAYVKYISGLPVWLGQFRTLFNNASGRCADDFVPAHRRARMGFEARIMLVGYLIIALGCYYFEYVGLMVAIWLLPLLFGQPFLRLFLLAEHGHCPHVANMFENTRTTFTSFIVRKLAWNMPYHAEHHAYPTVPFFRLPELHKLTREHLLQTENGYGNFNRKFVENITK